MVEIKDLLGSLRSNNRGEREVSTDVL